MDCRTNIHATSTKLGDTFKDELYSATVASQAQHMIAIHIDPVHRLFPLVYGWLSIESQVSVKYVYNSF